jgi:hypothetical protein
MQGGGVPCPRYLVPVRCMGMGDERTIWDLDLDLGATSALALAGPGHGGAQSAHCAACKLFARFS